MKLFDLPIKELWGFQPEQTKKKDFDNFWDEKIAQARAEELNIECIERPYYVKGVQVFDCKFNGFRNSSIHCVYVRPEKIQEEVPGVVMFHGYNWNNMQPHSVFKYTVQGIPALIVDVRGQNVHSPDHNLYINGGSSGWMTKGILDPDNYYYTQVYMDCFKAVEVLRTFKEIDYKRIILEGGSQGGALALATSALQDNIGLTLSDVPYLSHFRRSVELYGIGPYSEIYHYFKIHDPLHETESIIYDTLSYIDCMNLASRIKSPTLLSVGLEDDICPPSTAFAVYNHLRVEKDIKVYPEYAHGGFTIHDEEKLKFIKKHIGE